MGRNIAWHSLIKLKPHLDRLREFQGIAQTLDLTGRLLGTIRHEASIPIGSCVRNALYVHLPNSEVLYTIAASPDLASREG